MGNVAKKWTPAIAQLVLDNIAVTGTPRKAAEAVGVSTRLIHHYRAQDPEFAAEYAQCMDTAMHSVLGVAMERSLDPEAPSEKMVELMVKFRFPNHFNHLVVQTDNRNAIGLDPQVIARMAPADRDALINLLDKYVEASTAPAGPRALPPA